MACRASMPLECRADGWDGNHGADADDIKSNRRPFLPPQISSDTKKEGTFTITDLADGNPAVIIPPPIWLRPITLLVFGGIFTAMWIALIMLWKYNQKLNGFQLMVTSNHLSWTYGPTAILVIVVSFWRQIDYYIKLSQPWREMDSRFSTAKKTVLLDYLWPLQISSLIRAVGNQHYTVVLSILVFVFLKAATLLSTGLLIPLDIPVGRPLQITLQNTFNGDNFWPYVQSDYGNMSTSFVEGYIGRIRSDIQNRAIVDGKAIETFRVPLNREATNVTAVVDVFVPQIECEDAELTVSGGNETEWPFARITSKSCPFFHSGRNSTVQVSGQGIRYGYSCNTTCWENTIRNDTWIGNCSDSEKVGDLMISNNEGLGRFRIVAASTHVNVTTIVWNDTNDKLQSSLKMEMSGSRATICNIGYAIERGTVTAGQSNFSIVEMSESSRPRRFLDDLTEQQLQEILFAALSSAEIPSYLYNYPDDYGNNLFALARTYLDWNRTLLQNNAISSWEHNFIYDWMNVSFSNALSGLATQFIAQSFTTQTETPVEAVGTFLEKRLHLQVVILGFMVTLFILMSIMSVWLALVIRKAEHACAFRLWTRYIPIMARSTELRRLLRPFGHVNGKKLKTLIRDFTFMWSHHTFDCVEVSSLPGQGTTDCDTLDQDTSDQGSTDEHSDASLEVSSKVEQRGWTPAITRWYMFILLFPLPLLTITFLELLSSKSSRHNGLCTISSISSATMYTARYGSTLLALSIATVFNTLDFTIAVIAPFHLLSSRRYHHPQSLKLDTLGHTPPIAFLKAVISKQYGVSLSVLASLVASLLTIAASGLWTAVPHTTPYNVHVSRASVWTIQQRDGAGGDGGAAERLNAIQHGTQIPPAVIASGFVLPDLNGSTFDTESLSEEYSTSFNVSFIVPALRPRLECEIVSKSSQTTVYLYDGETFTFNMTTSARLPETCIPFGTSNKTIDVTISTNNKYINSSDTGNPRWYGTVTDLNSPDYQFSRMHHLVSLNDRSVASITIDGCPSLALQFAYASPNMSDSELTLNATSLLCYQRIEKVPLNVTYLGTPANNEIGIVQIPDEDENVDDYMLNATSNLPDLYFPIDSLLGFVRPYLYPYDGYLDPFVNLAIFGPNGTGGLQAARGEDGQARLMKAFQDVYTEYMLQFIDINFRHSASDGATLDQPLLLNGTLPINDFRLKVDNTSKLFLQVLLACMLILGAAAYILVKIRGVLPRNPCSLASTMALLAGSKICETSMYFEKAEAANDKSLQTTLAAGHVSLGWWAVDSQRDRYQRSDQLVIDDLDAIGQRPLENEMRHANSTAFEESDGEYSSKNQQSTQIQGSRFGIDVGTPEVYGFEARNSWLRNGIRKRQR